MVAVDGAGGDDVLAFVHEGQLGVVAHCGGKLAAMKNLQCRMYRGRVERGQHVGGSPSCLNGFQWERNQTWAARWCGG